MAVEHVPSPADVPSRTAEELLAEIRERDGRVHRMKEPPRVFVLTTNAETKQWLIGLGGKPWLPVHLKRRSTEPQDAYRRTPDTWEWDIVIDGIPVGGEQTMWEAAA